MNKHTKWWLAAFIAAQALDMGTTAYKLHQGCQEALWPTPAAMYGAKSAGIGLTLVLAHSHPTVAIAVSGVGIVSGAYGTIHNLRQSCW